MKTDAALALALGVAAAALAAGCLWQGLWPAAVLAVALMAGWWVAAHAGAGWLNAPLLVLSAGWCVMIAWLEAPPFYAILALAAVVCGWDMADFRQRLRAAGRVEGASDLERAHLARLAPVALGGGVLAIVVGAVRLELGFGVLMALGLAAIGSLYGLVWLLQAKRNR